MFYMIWVSVILVFYTVYAWASYRNNTDGGGWVYVIWLAGLFPGWALVSKYSKNIVFDGLLYDLVMVVTYTAVMVYLTESHARFTSPQWAGLAMAAGGLLLLKAG